MSIYEQHLVTAVLVWNLLNIFPMKEDSSITVLVLYMYTKQHKQVLVKRNLLYRSIYDVVYLFSLKWLHVTNFIIKNSCSHSRKRAGVSIKPSEVVNGLMIIITESDLRRVVHSFKCILCKKKQIYV